MGPGYSVLNYRVIPTEQGKSVSLPARGTSIARWTDGDADSGTEKKRMLPFNRADRGCVALGTTSPRRKRSRLLGGAQTRERLKNQWMKQSKLRRRKLLVQLHTRLVDFIHRRASWRQACIE